MKIPESLSLISQPQDVCGIQVTTIFVSTYYLLSRYTVQALHPASMKFWLKPIIYVT